MSTSSAAVLASAYAACEQDARAHYENFPVASLLLPKESRPHVAALYAFARARCRPILCFAHVTNQMAVIEGDFEKGEADGSAASLGVIAIAGRAWRGSALSRIPPDE